jgi:hypothetical protein
MEYAYWYYGNRRRKAAKVIVLSVFILAKSSTMSYAYEKGIGNPSGQQTLIRVLPAATW